MDDTLVVRRITLQEFGAARVVQAGEIDLSALQEANSQWARRLGLASDPIRVTALGDGRFTLRAESVTGVVRVGETDLEIAPKFLRADLRNWQSVLWQILATVDGGYVDNRMTTAHEVELLSVPDLLAEVFISSYERGAARGLPRGYRTEQAEGPVLRGSLDTSRLIERVARPWEMPYTADVLTDDTPLARLLRWAAWNLSTTVESAARARSLREIVSTLSHVGLRPPHLFDARRLSLGPQHQGLEGARAVSILLLEGSGMQHAEGKHQLSGFLWKSDDVYENYVFWLCRQAATRSGHCVRKMVEKFGEVVAGPGSRLETTPDVVFEDRQGRVTAVADAKYKRFGSRPKSSDTYQVLTAGHVLGCQHVSLTYPVDLDQDSTTWRVPSALGGADIYLTRLPLNLMALATPEGQDQLISSIDQWLPVP